MEHYSADPTLDIPESFSLVTFGTVERQWECCHHHFQDPHWRLLAREQVERFTGPIWEPESVK